MRESDFVYMLNDCKSPITYPFSTLAYATNSLSGFLSRKEIIFSIIKRACVVVCLGVKTQQIQFNS